ncbi:MAG: DUF4394 domain-containing protein [Pseudonocardiaceae bacterium]
MRNIAKIGGVVLAGLVFLTPSALAHDRNGPTARQGAGLMAVGLLDDQRLVHFDTGRPGNAAGEVKVSGLTADTALIGIDYRVQNNLLYGVGNQGGIYTLDPNNGAAVKVSQLSVALDGQFFGVDFNPPANRLRVISDTGQNLRHNIDDNSPNAAPAPGNTAEDKRLTTPTSTDTTTVTSGVTAAGYTNNDLIPTTATTLFDINTTNDTLVLQSPANAGTLAPSGQLTVDAGTDAGLDIYSVLDESGTTVDNRAFATLQAGGRYALYDVNLLTGKATSCGEFHSGMKVVDLAIPLDQR